MRPAVVLAAWAATRPPPKPLNPAFGSAILALVMVAAAPGCRPSSPQAPGLEARLEVKPQPPRQGPAAITVSLSEADGRPVAGAEVKLEGNMTHAGMVPVFASARESAPGRYEAPIEFTMGGDWYILVTASLPDGRRLERQFPVPGVVSR